MAQRKRSSIARLEHIAFNGNGAEDPYVSLFVQGVVPSDRAIAIALDAFAYYYYYYVNIYALYINRSEINSLKYI